MDDDAPLAVLPSSMGQQQPGAKKKLPDVRKFIPSEKGGLVLSNPQEEESPYTFSDSPAYLRQKEAEERAKRAAELESKDETRGFLQSVEVLAKKQKWDEAFKVLERRTAVPSGLFLVTRAVLRWRFGKYCGALRDAEEALKSYGSSAKAGPLAAAFSAFARICLGSCVRDKGSCSKEMKELVTGWEEAEMKAVVSAALGQGLFHPREVPRLQEPCTPCESMEALDGSYVAETGLRIGYVLLKNQKDPNAPLVVHFHGSSETAADYRGAALAEKYRGISVHLLVVDYRGYGWSGGEPSLATFLRDAEPLAEKLPELLIQHGFAWPYPGGLVLSGRSLGAQVAVHLAACYPELFRALVLDSALATSATGDRLGRAPERSAALKRWHVELESANLEILQPLDADLRCVSALEKIRSYEGQLLVLHGLADEMVPYEGSESLHAACETRRKELVLVEGAGHNNIGQFEEYWAAQRRFALKVQLDDALPSVGPTVEHFCAVCAVKAVSKCGRCMKVWYCGRQHQAEHWKSHKAACGSGPPEPKVKVEPEGDACLVAALAVEVKTELELSDLASCLASIGAQDQPLHSLWVSWHAEAEAMVVEVEKLLQDFQEKHCQLNVRTKKATSSLSQLEHIKACFDAFGHEAPSHTWVTFPDAHGLWSPRYSAVLVPALRRAAPEQRVIAVACPRLAQPSGKIEAPLSTPEQVEAAISSGTAELTSDSTEQHVSDLTVRLKTLQGFLECTPGAALAHELCGHRLQYQLRNTFGKKVQTLSGAPDGEWLRWRPDPLEGRPKAAARSAEDEELGREIFATMPRTGAPPVDGEPTHDNSEGGDAPMAPASGAADGPLSTPESAASAIAGLRHRIERSLIQSAGQKMTPKDLRRLGAEHMSAFLEQVGLGEVIGISKWAKETSQSMCEQTARKFMVEIVAE